MLSKIVLLMFVVHTVHSGIHAHYMYFFGHKDYIEDPETYMSPVQKRGIGRRNLLYFDYSCSRQFLSIFVLVI